jgi:Tfp pilus assembly protein PilO
MKARDRLVLGIVVVAGVMAALWFTALAPKREKAAGIETQITQAEQRREAATTKAQQADLARSTYARDYATVARLGKATPAQADVPSLVYQLETAARQAKVDFRSVSVQDQPADGAADTKPDPATPAGITPLPFNLTFDGSFFKLDRLLRSIDGFSKLKGETVKIKGRLLTLDSVKLSPGRKGFPNVKVEITARAYVAPLPDQLPGGANPAGTSAAPQSTATQVAK